MINLEKINREILDLEQHDTTYATCERLAWLYTVRDHITNQPVVQPKPVDVSGKSEFLQAVNGRDSTSAWMIMDELMEALMVVNRRTYDAVIRRMRSIPDEAHQTQDHVNVGNV